MSKLAGPLHSDAASGKTGDVVYAQWKGIKYSRLNPLERKDAKTASQQVIRGYFTTAVAAWHAENNTVRIAWTSYTKSHSLSESGFNLYVGKYIKFLTNSSGTPPTVTNTPPNMT